MALKIGRLEVGLRLLVSFISIAIAYGYLGSYLSKLLSSSNYSPSSGNHLVAGSLIALAIAGVFAIPQSLGGLLAAIAALGVVYWQSNLINSLITVAVCLLLYWLGFADLRYNPAPDKKLSIIEILATLVTVALTVAIAISMFQIPENRLASAAIGAIGASFTMIGKQIQYLELRPVTNFIILGILSSSSLIIGFVIRAIFYTPKPSHFL
jgi:hypothetical protein